MLCHTKGIDLKMEEQMRRTGGLESVFLYLMKKKYKNMLCVDNRIEMGMLTSIEEHTLKTIISSLTCPSPENIDVSFKVVAKLLSVVEHILDHIIDIFNGSVYEELMRLYAASIEIQTVMLYNLKRLYSEKKLVFEDNTLLEEVNNWHIFTIILNMLLENIVKIGSLLVDLNIINIIEKTKRKHYKILVFVGNNHLERLVLHYKDYGKTFYKKNFNPELSNMMPSNSLARDRRMLDSIKELELAAIKKVKKSDYKKTTSKSSDVMKASEKAGKILERFHKQ
jgi:hypothetical protein